MTSDRSFLSIGEVLGLLTDDFPDVTISKIRFLESQGLLDPERTPSGYRKFYERDVARLRWVLLQQRDHFLPLKVIKERLDEADRLGVPPEDLPSGPPAAAEAATAPADAPGAGSPPRSAAPATVTTEPASAPAAPRAGAPAGEEPAGRAPPGGHSPLDPGATTTSSYTADELLEATGLTAGQLRELEQYGLVTGRTVGGTVYYDAEAYLVARLGARLLGHGVEPRHLRMYKTSVQREAAFYEQVVMPLLKQRNPRARAEARQTLAELAELGERVRASLLRQALAPYLGEP